MRIPLANVIHDPSRSAAAPPIPHQVAKPHFVEKGFLNVERVPSTTGIRANSEHSPNPQLECQYHDATNNLNTHSGHSGSISTLSEQAQPSMSNTPTITTRETVERLARKRVADSLAERQPAENVALVSNAQS